MNWHARLAERRGEDISKRVGGLTDKTDKRGFVSFVSDPDGRSENIAPDLAPLADALKSLRAHLLALAAAEGMDVDHVHRLHDADVAACIGLDVRQLADYLAMLADTADRHAGRVPLDDTAAIHCEQCGPVWIHPTIAEVLPVVDGWPRALGCPWCFVRKTGGYIPRPSVTCEGCRHFTPDTINPAAGMGTCGAGKGMHWPMARHTCADHRPTEGNGL
jgi:hypothetical protein